MDPNMGQADKLTRIGIGFVAAFLVIFTAGWLSVVFLIITLLMFTTVAFEYCPVYALFGWSTIKKAAAPVIAKKAAPSKAPTHKK